MKQKLLFVITTLIFSNTFAQTKSIVPVIAQSAEYIRLIEEKHKKQILSNEYQYIFDTQELYKEFYEGFNYGLIVLGDNDVKDISLYIYSLENNDWQLVAKDENTDAIAMIDFLPQKSDLYKITIKVSLYDPDKFGFYNLIIFQQ